MKIILTFLILLFTTMLQAADYKLVYFEASWCGSCVKMTPVLDEYVKESKVNVTKVDIDKETDIATEYKVKKVPTVAIVQTKDKKNKEIGRLEGFRPLAQFKVAIKEILNKK